jgi:hypothetical protein
MSFKFCASTMGRAAGLKAFSGSHASSGIGALDVNGSVFLKKCFAKI